MTKYLDETGLSYFWTKIKGWLSSHAPVKYFGSNWVVDSNDDYAIVVGNGADNSNLANCMTVDNDGVIDVYAPNITNTAINSYLYQEALRIKDDEGNRRGYVGLVNDTDNNQGIVLASEREYNNANYYNGVDFNLDPTGNPITSFVGSGAKRAFQDALTPWSSWGLKIESDSDVTAADNATWSGSDTFPNLCFVDRNGVTIANLEAEIKTDGKCGIAIVARNYDTSGNEVGHAELGVRMTKAGEPQFWTSNSANFRAGIGGLANGVWPVGIGGTGQGAAKQINVTSSNVGAASGMSVDGGQFIVWGHVVMLHLVVKTTTAISIPSNGFVTDKHLATINNTSLRPSVDMTWFENGNDSIGGATGIIDSSGRIMLQQCDGTGSARTAAANSNIDIFCVYLRGSSTPV